MHALVPRITNHVLREQCMKRPLYKSLFCMRDSPGCFFSRYTNETSEAPCRKISKAYMSRFERHSVVQRLCAPILLRCLGKWHPKCLFNMTEEACFIKDAVMTRRKKLEENSTRKVCVVKRALHNDTPFPPFKNVCTRLIAKKAAGTRTF